MGDQLDDKIHASAVRFLIDGHEDDAAALLLSCSVQLRHQEQDWGVDYYNVIVSGPRAAYDTLMDDNHPITQAVRKAFEAVFPIDTALRWIIPRGELIEVDTGWKNDFQQMLTGKTITNQLADQAEFRLWRNLRFRSESEVRIAAALDAARALFLPNCRARLSTPVEGGRINQEPDFLVCLAGKWGILEVDGDKYHPPSRAAEDHDRDRLFRLHGIKVVEHFKATDCWNDAPGVVARFMNILKNNG